MSDAIAAMKCVRTPQSTWSSPEWGGSCTRLDWSRMAGTSEELGCGQAGGRPAGPTLRLVALDLDGVVYRGAAVLPGVLQALADILHRKLGLRYVTNNATAHRRDVARRLAGMGLPADESLVLSSAYAAALWLRGRLSAAAPVMVVGELGLISELREVGLDAHYATDPAWDAASGSSSGRQWRRPDAPRCGRRGPRPQVQFHCAGRGPARHPARSSICRDQPGRDLPERRSD